MSKDDSKEAVGQEADNQEPVDQETLNHEPVNHDPVDPVDQETLDQEAAEQKAVDEATELTKDNPEVFPVYIEFLCRGTVNSVTLFTSDDNSRRTTAGIFNAIVFAAKHGLSSFQDRLMTAQILTDEPLSIPIWAEYYGKMERGNIFRDYVAQVIAYELGVLWGPEREVDRDEVDKMLTGDKQLNGDVLSNGVKQPNGDTHANGVMHVNGDAFSNGVMHVNGDSLSNGHNHLPFDAQLLDDVLDYMKPISGNTPTHPNIAPVCFYHLHPPGADCPDMAYPMSDWIM
ncbi:hypothetical protein V495_01043 [Pseudogymnoascus sp. VKM F-4514 (FW-929)]|nr:hypothetical protein V495_01043 [Pseudogymnoascus sp. VKM F-4514 (FW-929)]KFY60921.1 hypothetical protein V497_03229 [Pseudogymnoascus sp. VKM F-4516 (FW-969)]